MQQFGASGRKIAAFAAKSLPGRNVAQLRRSFVTATHSRSFPMKAGTPLKDLGIFKGKDAPVTMERSEYPDWVNDLTEPQASLAALRKIPNEEAELHEIKRYLKLTRRQGVRQRNEESAV